MNLAPADYPCTDLMAAGPDLLFLSSVSVETPDTADAAVAAATAAAANVTTISRDETTPSPELGVKERYRHMLTRRVSNDQSTQQYCAC